MEILGDSIDVEQKVSKVSIAEQQMIEIAKAVSVEPKVLIMDEPTAALNDQETESLLNFWNRLRKKAFLLSTSPTAFQKSVALLTVSRS